MNDTTSFKTPVDGLEVTIKAYLTGHDKREMFRLKDDPVGLQDAMIKRLVVKVGDHTGAGTDEKVFDMHGKDFDFVVSELLKVAEGSSLTDEKKTS